MADLPRHLFPEKYLEIESYCGEEIAKQLVAHFGGVTVSVPLPENLIPEHPLVAALGFVNAYKLAKAYGSSLIKVPKCDGALRAIRNAEIRELRKTMRCAQVARRFGLSERSIEIICNNISNENQQDLFDFE